MISYFTYSILLSNPCLPHIKISLWGLERPGGGAEAQLQAAMVGRRRGGSRAADRLTPASALFTVPPSTWAQQGGESFGLRAQTHNFNCFCRRTLLAHVVQLGLLTSMESSAGQQNMANKGQKSRIQRVLADFRPPRCFTLGGHMYRLRPPYT